MHHWYNKFMRESPSGLITLFELKAILGLKRMTEDANSYVDQVFMTFDMDGVRTVSLSHACAQPCSGCVCIHCVVRGKEYSLPFMVRLWSMAL